MSELICPVPLCDHREEISEVDPDTSLSEMFAHFGYQHPSADPDTLLAFVEVTG